MAIALAAWASPGLAWGPEGHEVIAHLAARELTSRARAQVAALLGGQAEPMMVADANWADEIRDFRPDTARWHFVNIPLDAPRGFDRARDCAADDCVVARIEQSARTAADRRLPRARRAEALEFLIHFVGDVHQPLHAIDNRDNGGNGIAVRLERFQEKCAAVFRPKPRQNKWAEHFCDSVKHKNALAGMSDRTNMHRVWDTLLVEMQGGDAARVATEIEAGIAPRQRAAWQSGTPAGWANESWQVARQQIYARIEGHRGTIRLPRSYLAQEAGPVRIQLAKAGIRLAWMLNAMLR